MHNTPLLSILAASILIFNSCDSYIWEDSSTTTLDTPVYDGLVFIHDEDNGNLCTDLSYLFSDGSSLCDQVIDSSRWSHGLSTYHLDGRKLKRELLGGLYTTREGLNGGSSIGLNYKVPIYSNEYISKNPPIDHNASLPTPNFVLNSNPTTFNKHLPSIGISVVDDSVSEEFIKGIFNQTNGQIRIKNESCSIYDKSDSYHGEQVSFVMVEELLSHGVKNPIEITVVDVVEETDHIPYVSSFKLMCALNMIKAKNIAYVNMSLGFKHKTPQLLNQIRLISNNSNMKITAALGNESLELSRYSCGITNMDQILPINLPAQYSHCDLNEGVIYPVMGIEIDANRITKWTNRANIGSNYINNYQTFADFTNYEGVPKQYYGTSYSAPRILAKLVAGCQFTDHDIEINNENISTSIGCSIPNLRT